MFLERVKVIEHKPDGTDVVIKEQTWSSAYGNTKWPSVFVRNSFFEQRGEEGKRNLGDEEHHVAKIDDVPTVIANAAHKARELANAIRLEAGLPV